MAIRIEVTPDAKIEILRSPVNGGRPRFLTINGEERAMRIIRYLLERDIRAAKAERFVPEFEKECKQAQREIFQRRG
jgi:hypothetical protein